MEIEAISDIETHSNLELTRGNLSPFLKISNLFSLALSNSSPWFLPLCFARWLSMAFSFRLWLSSHTAVDSSQHNWRENDSDGPV